MLNLAQMGAEYELSWPVEVFREEARAILAGSPDLFVEHADLLLIEAFIDSVPVHEFRRVGFVGSVWDPPAPTGAEDPKRIYVSDLVRLADQLPTARSARPFWLQRQGVANPVPSAQSENFRTRWLRVAQNLLQTGYLSQAADESCVDGPSEHEIDQNLARQIERRVGHPGLWPLPSQAEDPNDDFLYTVVEVFDELVARPRSRYDHPFANCGWHHREHARVPGKAVYRWRVNELLKQAGQDLRLASEGEDAGRLVHEVSDPRVELVTEVLQTPDQSTQVSVSHAIALFRKRGATREDKRSACVNLARVLENRRPLIDEQLLNNDAKLIYISANKWDIRHSDGKQYTEQGEEFQDWVFWMYLATVELSNRLIERQKPDVAPGL